jgi:hypothetical protein
VGEHRKCCHSLRHRRAKANYQGRRYSRQHRGQAAAWRFRNNPVKSLDVTPKVAHLPTCIAVSAMNISQRCFELVWVRLFDPFCVVVKKNLIDFTQMIGNLMPPPLVAQ